MAGNAAEMTALPRVGSAASRRKKLGRMNSDDRRKRRDRTFVGSICVVCEERLEHSLGNERAIQMACSHVVHESCFHEYISEIQETTCPKCGAPLALEAGRGKVPSGPPASYARELPQPTFREASRMEESSPTWDESPPTQGRGTPSGRRAALPPKRTSQLASPTENTTTYGHRRNTSAATEAYSEVTVESESPFLQRSELESQTSSRIAKDIPKNPLPAPSVRIRSEYPTITRSRQQQSLTCLVSVEAVERRLQAMPESAGMTPPIIPPPLPKAPVRTKTRRNQPKVREKFTLENARERLQKRVETWHGLDMSKFGDLYLHAHIRVGKDQVNWQDLECYLFSEMLICVKEKKVPVAGTGEHRTRCTLKGSILIKKHLEQVEVSYSRQILTLRLSVADLPQFHLQFNDNTTIEIWRQALSAISSNKIPIFPADMPNTQGHNSDDEDQEVEEEEEEENVTNTLSSDKHVSSNASSHEASSAYIGPHIEPLSNSQGLQHVQMGAELHVPLDIVVVIPVSSSMQGLKIALLRDALRFLVAGLGTRDRMALVSFGSTGGGMPLVDLTGKTWPAWPQVLDSIKPVGPKHLRADAIEGVNVAMDVLMQRRTINPVCSILLISDSSTSEMEGIDYVVSRAEAARVSIYSFGLGLTHKPDGMIEMSNRTKASYTYIKDWNTLRECVAGCLGALQSTSHQNARLKLSLPEGSPAKFVKVSGALFSTMRAGGREAEATLGDLKFGDTRSILVQLVIEPVHKLEQNPSDAWESIVSGLVALGGDDGDDIPARSVSVEEVPLIQADLTYGDVLREGQPSQLPRPTLLTITLLPATNSKLIAAGSPPSIPPHPSIVQRRIELLATDMLTRALALVARGQHDRAHQLLTETRSIIKGLGKGGLPPLPPPTITPTLRIPPTPTSPRDRVRSPTPTGSTRTHQRSHSSNSLGASVGSSKPSTATSIPITASPSVPVIDPATVAALDAELAASIEWIQHPAVFSHDARKAVLQAIGIMSSQRAYTTRTPLEALWAERIPGIRRIGEMEREWRDRGMGTSEDVVVEEWGEEGGMI